LLRALTDELVELPRNREGSFCCGAGGAQFWKEEEPGPEKIASNRLDEAQRSLGKCSGNKTLAVGCPFCKSMLSSTPGQATMDIQIRDVAELLLDNILPNSKEQCAPIEQFSGAGKEPQG
jgi:Fe-S oxidoreductase